jgi:hypothetical protein
MERSGISKIAPAVYNPAEKTLGLQGPGIVVGNCPVANAFLCPFTILPLPTAKNLTRALSSQAPTPSNPLGNTSPDTHRRVVRSPKIGASKNQAKIAPRDRQFFWHYSSQKRVIELLLCLPRVMHPQECRVGGTDRRMATTQSALCLSVTHGSCSATSTVTGPLIFAGVRIARKSASEEPVLYVPWTTPLGM